MRLPAGLTLELKLAIQLSTDCSGILFNIPQYIASTEELTIKSMLSMFTLSKLDTVNGLFGKIMFMYLLIMTFRCLLIGC